MTDKFKFDPEHTFFTSDTHFGHANIINLCNRPFKDVNHMNDMLVENWNSVVTDDDTVFHLGDFALGGSAVWSNVLSRLKGKIYLILGNHDRKNIRQGYMGKFEIVVPQMHNGYIWLLKHSGKPVDVPTIVSYTDSDKLYKFEGTVTLSND